MKATYSSNIVTGTAIHRPSITHLIIQTWTKWTKCLTLKELFSLLVELAFLREYLISQLLEKGYTVRATARSTAKLQAIFPQATMAQLEILEVPALTSDHTAALKGTEALIHSASPVFGEGITGQDLYSGAYEGTVAVVKQFIAAGVSGTFVNLFDADFQAAFGTRVLIEKDLGSITP